MTTTDNVEVEVCRSCGHVMVYADKSDTKICCNEHCSTRLKTSQEPADEYAIVEIFGHRRHVGRVTEVDRFGAKLLRIDVPKTGKFEDGYDTHFYGGGSIFSLTPCDLPTVSAANARREHPPAQLSYASDEDEDIF